MAEAAQARDVLPLTVPGIFAQSVDMLQVIQQLLILQDRDRKIRTLKGELKLVPLERKNLDEKLAGAQGQLEAEKRKAMEIEVERKRLENEVQAKRDTIAKYNTQKFQTRKNEEFQALTNEIKRFEGEISAIEDRELELMEAAEAQKLRVASAEKELADTKARHATQVKDLEDKLAAIRTQLGELETERTRLAGEIDEDLLDTYNRLFASKSDHAVVGLEHDVCTGCHMKLTPSTSAKVRAAKEVAHCEQCGRILYWVE